MTGCKVCKGEHLKAFYVVGSPSDESAASFSFRNCSHFGDLSHTEAISSPPRWKSESFWMSLCSVTRSLTIELMNLEKVNFLMKSD